MLPELTVKDSFDVIVAVGLMALAVERWVRGREGAEIRHSGDAAQIKRDIDRIEREYKIEDTRLWESIDEIHAKASTMASEFQSRGGDLSVGLEVLRSQILDVKASLNDLQRINHRRTRGD